MFKYHVATDSRGFAMNANGKLVRLATRQRGVLAVRDDGVAIGRGTLLELLDALGVSRCVMFQGECECGGDLPLTEEEWAAATSA